MCWRGTFAIYGNSSTCEAGDRLTGCNFGINAPIYIHIRTSVYLFLIIQESINLLVFFCFWPRRVGGVGLAANWGLQDRNEVGGSLNSQHNNDNRPGKYGWITILFQKDIWIITKEDYSSPNSTSLSGQNQQQWGRWALTATALCVHIGLHRSLPSQTQKKIEFYNQRELNEIVRSVSSRRWWRRRCWLRSFWRWGLQ